MAWTHARQLVAGFQVLCSLYRLTCVGLRSKLSWIRLTFSSDTRGRPELLPLHRQPICSNWWFQRQMLFPVGGWMLKRRRNARCTAVVDSVLMNSRTQKILCAIVVILSFCSQMTLLHGCALGERSSGGVCKFRTSSFKFYLNHSHTMYSWRMYEIEYLFESPCIHKKVDSDDQQQAFLNS